jgi:serine/threonine protein phosphatase 1
MRTLVIGDIHGCLHAFNGLLDAIHPAPTDQLILLGDYVDRGPDTRGVIDRILQLAKTHNVIPLRGNHEDMMLDARHDINALRGWCLSGGEAALRSYAPGVAAYSLALQRIPDEHWNFIQFGCRDYFETSTHIYVHGYVDPALPMIQQDPYTLHWQKFHGALPHISRKTIVCGHTAQRDQRPKNLGYAICIDTHIYGGGWLTCLEPATGRLWQANQQGQMQTGHIESYRV